ncbi:MAG: N-6 DNA methylase [Gemmatimonadetes bacterium]|nr:N-6 DNA methylase [Gemmatimonadota bacterium]
MRLSWNEIRTRAANFAREWKDAGYEKGETQSFYNEFFEIFGVKRRTVARYEEQVKRLDDSHGFIDLFWPGVLLVEQKSAGRDLKKARDQADAYFDALPVHEQPRYQLQCDFQTFEMIDRDERDEVCFALADLPDHVEKFGFILGVQKRTFKDQDPVNIAAAERVGLLHDALAESGYTGHDLEQFLVRIVFCFFADDTGIFEPRDIFLDYLENRTSEDGSDLGSRLMHLFQVLNTPEDRRVKTLDEDLDRFPYVNGELFRDTLPIPSFDSEMRRKLIDACNFNWSNISPAIFGSLFQSVMDSDQRRRQGAHYTTERNILKVIEPLLLDELRAEFKRLKARRDTRRIPELIAFQQRLGTLRLFDPACGCGNFLIIAYRELRELEIEVLKEIRSTGQIDAFAELLSVVDVDQFYGIELGEFPAHIAEVALWMMDHIMNNRLSLEFGKTYVRIPLEKSPHIRQGDALEVDWSELLPPEECSYVLGNPPFVGAKFQSQEQREQVRNIAALGKSGGTLDYVTAWFVKAGEYVQNSAARIGFVATNSITQGEQVAQLWPILFERHKLEISFAHRTFAWGSDARGKAQVHVVIIGLAKRNDAPRQKRLFSYDTPNSDPQQTQHVVLSPYLFDASGLADPQVVVKEVRQPINGLPKLITGTQPLEGGFLLFDRPERDQFLKLEPEARNLFRPFPGSHEFINGIERWILHSQDLGPEELRQMPEVVQRLKSVTQFRESSKRRTTLALSKYPTLYGVTVLPESPFLVCPQVSSERREYVPIGWLKPPTIPSEKLRLLLQAELWHFALLTSGMHMAWMRAVTGRLESRYMYSVGVVYNTFPLPPVQSERLEGLEPYADAVLSARTNHPDATLADLYDPDLMPPDLRKAHQALDRAVDRLYRRSGFASERERVEHLLGLYEKMVAPVTAMVKPKRRRRKAK